MRTKVENKLRSNMLFKLIDNFCYNVTQPNVYDMVNDCTWTPVANIIFDHIALNIKHNKQPYIVNKQSIINSLLKTGL